MFMASLPEEVNYRKFAGDRVKLDGSVPVSSFHRLVESIANNKGEVHVKLEFRKGKKQKTLIIGKISVDLKLTCQNCLELCSFQVDSSFRWVLVEDEDALIALNSDDEGVICAEDKVNIVALLEDELLVSLPMVAKHPAGECSFVAEHGDDKAVKNGEVKSGAEQKTVRQASPDERQADTYQPFASLAELKNQFDRS
jgi:uncharacterized protein